MATDATLPLEQPGVDPVADELAQKLEKRRAKVRSAWISFVGRIVAQIMGAVATITLGLILVQKYSVPVTATAVPAAPSETVVAAGPLRVRIVTPGYASLAVLPLEDIAGRDATFAAGMTDALITELAHLDGVRVISRTSSATYANVQRSLPAIAQELAVDFVVDGSVTQGDGRVRITLRLVDAQTDECVFAEAYERPLRQVLGLQAEVARIAARKVQLAMSTEVSGTGPSQRLRTTYQGPGRTATDTRHR
jgi:TolB-like protein